MQIMKKKNCICLLFVAFLLLKGTCAYAQKVFIDSVYYTLDNTAMTAQIAVQSNNTAVGDIVINDTVTYEGELGAVRFSEVHQSDNLHHSGQYDYGDSVFGVLESGTH